MYSIVGSEINLTNNCLNAVKHQLKKLLPTSVKNVVLFSSYGYRYHFSEQCGNFSVMDTDESTPLINVCSETSIQQIRLPNAVNKLVLFFSYGDKLLNKFK